ncbi:hypothetical protein BG004_000037 [Podila humilis]|nr:hypothetical protein BG004_000037 [Podila humilis]
MHYLTGPLLQQHRLSETKDSFESNNVRFKPKQSNTPDQEQINPASLATYERYHQTAPRPGSARKKKRPGRNELTFQQRLRELAAAGDADGIYEEFWSTATTVPKTTQRSYWNMDSDTLESIYRAMNSRRRPVTRKVDTEEHVILPRTPITGSLAESPPNPSPNDLPMALHYIESSHRARLLQIHQYIESILNLTASYYAQIALLNSFCSAGDMITAMKLFDRWRHQPSTGPSTKTKRRTGKEMYSVMIRGLVGRNFQDRRFMPFRAARDTKTSMRNSGTTQIYAALELFYDLLRKGGTPTFETYHSLVVGMTAFKNDMEAAELLLDHMLVTKRKPYVQVLHVMIREYSRRRDFQAAERIFSMLREYRIRPRALTCNMVMKAVFEMSALEAQEYISQMMTLSDNGQGRNQLKSILEAKDPVSALKLWKVQEIRTYMRRNRVTDDQSTYSILIFGYGHLPSASGREPMKRIMSELAHSNINPNLAVLSSLLFAHLQHNVDKAEAMLDKMIAHSLEEQDRYLLFAPSSHEVRVFHQAPSPFRSQATPFKPDSVGIDDEFSVNTPQAVLGKGPFHALMLAMVERGDTGGMERVVDKMMAAAEENNHRRLEQSAAQVKRRPVADLKADENTAKIMLLGYLTARDFDKAATIQTYINSRPEWAHLHQHGITKTVEEARLQTPTVFELDQAKVFGETEGGVDDLEIDVTALSAKLRGQMESASV